MLWHFTYTLIFRGLLSGQNRWQVSQTFSRLKHSMTLLPVIFVIGPSGAGKSEISEWVAADLQFLHIDIDRHHGFGASRLRREWHQFSSQLNPKPLVSVLQNRIVAAGRSGAVLSFPSTRILTRAQIDAAKSFGIVTALLWGPKELCKKAALERANGPVLNEGRYDRSNKKAFDTYGGSEYDNVRVEAFRPDGRRWSREDMVRIIRKLIVS